MRHLSVGLLMLLLAALASGCGMADKAAKKAVEQATGVKVNENKDGSTTVTTKDGSVTYTDSSSTGGSAKLPDGFPLTLPAGVKVTDAAKLTVNNKNNYSLQADMKGDPKEMADFFEKQIKGKGLEVSRMEFQSGDEQSFLIQGTGKGSVAMVTIAYDTKRKDGQVTIVWGDE